MKSINIVQEYTNFIEKNLKKIAKLVLDRHYSEEQFLGLLTVYIKTRYYDALDRKSKSPYFNTKLYVKDELTKLRKQKQTSESVIKVYEEIINYELNNYTAKDLLNSTEKYRLELKVKNPNLDTEITNIYNKMSSKKKEIKKAFLSNDFSCRYEETNLHKVYNVSLDYWFQIPKLYSEYAIDKVYNTDTINEDKMYIEYYIVTSKLLTEITNFDFSNNYLIDFAYTLFKKDVKLNKLLNTIANDICKEKMSIKISYTDFKNYREKIVKLVNNGYNFALKIDDTYQKSEDNKFITSIFKYIIIDEKNQNIQDFKDFSNLIRIK